MKIFLCVVGVMYGRNSAGQVFFCVDVPVQGIMSKLGSCRRRAVVEKVDVEPSPQVVLLDFTRDNCGPCKLMDETMQVWWNLTSFF
jgi:hypothetical protein